MEGICPDCDFEPVAEGRALCWECLNRRLEELARRAPTPIGLEEPEVQDRWGEHETDGC